MKLSASLIVGALLVAGIAAIGHAQAATSSSSSQQVSNQYAANQYAANNNGQSVMDQLESRPSGTDKNVVLGGSTQNDVKVRDPNVPFDPNRTFQGWWKDD